MHARFVRIRKIIPRLLWLFLALALPGCQPALMPSPIATPRVVSVQASAALLPVQPLMKICTTEQENTAVVFSQGVYTPGNPLASDIALRWGLNAQPPGFAAVLGYEDLVLVVHPQNPASQFSQDQVMAIWSGAVRKWPGDSSGAEIQPWVYPASEDSEQIFEHIFLGGALPAKNSVYIAPDPAAMIEAVFSSQSAAGFLPRRWLNQQVKEIQVVGAGQSLRQPILALTKSKPEGLVKNWLLCLQDHLSR